MHSASVRFSNRTTSLVAESALRAKPKKRASVVEITQMRRQIRVKEVQIFRNCSAPLAQKRSLHSPSVRCANRTTSLKLSKEMSLLSNPYCARRDRAEFAPLKKFEQIELTKCKIFGFSARHAHQEMRAFDQRALQKPSDVTGTGS